MTNLDYKLEMCKQYTKVPYRPIYLYILNKTIRIFTYFAEVVLERL